MSLQENIERDEENDCWSGYGSSDPTDRSRDDTGGLYVVDSDVGLELLLAVFEKLRKRGTR